MKPWPKQSVEGWWSQLLRKTAVSPTTELQSLMTSTVLDHELVADESTVRRVQTFGVVARIIASIPDISPDAYSKLFAAAPSMAALLLDEEYQEEYDTAVYVTRLTCRRCGERNFNPHKANCKWLTLMKAAGLR